MDGKIKDSPVFKVSPFLVRSFSLKNYESWVRLFFLKILFSEKYNEHKNHKFQPYDWLFSLNGINIVMHSNSAHR